jgi:hypothetical protein
MLGDEAGSTAAKAMACGELVAIVPTLAEPSDTRDVEALVAQLEAAAPTAGAPAPQPSWGTTTSPATIAMRGQSRRMATAATNAPAT